MRIESPSALANVRRKTMAHAWNLTAQEWSHVLLKGSILETLRSDLSQGKLLPWTAKLLQLTAASERVLDLGSGRGENAAVLALQGRETTLLDWSEENLKFSQELHNTLGLHSSFCRADMTDQLPFQSKAFDTVFSCGVFEYFNDEVTQKVLAEASRVAAKRVIIMVPNALSIPYRVGKWHLEKTRQWPWGGEVPSFTLKPYFRALGFKRITEFTLATRHSLNFLNMPAGEAIKRLCIRFLRLRHHTERARFRQGYLLVTIAEIV